MLASAWQCQSGCTACKAGRKYGSTSRKQKGRSCSKQYESILVYYYDVEAVAARGKAEADLDDEDEDVEASSIKEVLDWIKKTS